MAMRIFAQTMSGKELPLRHKKSITHPKTNVTTDYEEISDTYHGCSRVRFWRYGTSSRYAAHAEYLRKDRKV